MISSKERRRWWQKCRQCLDIKQINSQHLENTSCKNVSQSSARELTFNSRMLYKVNTPALNGRMLVR